MLRSADESFETTTALLRRNSARLGLVEFILTHAQEAVMIYDVPPGGADSRVVFVNPAFVALSGADRTDVLRRIPVLGSIDFALDSPQPSWVTLPRSSGEEFPLEVLRVPLEDDNAEVTHIVAFCRYSATESVTERETPALVARVKAVQRRNTSLKRAIDVCKRTEAKLLQATHHDSLTGLPTRSLFLERVHLALQESKKDTKSISVLFLDCDRFKLVNDTFGHRVGDLLLTEVARRVKTCLRPLDILARMGGDEFTILLQDGHERAIATNVAQRISKTFEAPFHLEGEEVYLTASIGIALSKPADCAEDLVRDADIAMYRAKELGKHRYEVFSNEFRDRLLRRRLLDTELRRALDYSQLSVAYQPIISLADGKLEGFEALIRWRHAELGQISPEELIGVAEESGLIVDVGDWILCQACAEAQRWQRQFPHVGPLSISVNVSAKQLIDERFTRRVCNALMQSGLRAELLRLEITESSLMTNLESASSVLATLRSIEVQSYIDDFGTGYSSLTYLQQLPVGVLKIDRSFVSGTNTNNDLANRTIVKTILSLAQNLGLRVVAEGVESVTQARELRALDCTFAQGYIFSKPIEKDAVGEYIASYGRASIELNAQICTDGAAASS